MKVGDIASQKIKDLGINLPVCRSCKMWIDTMNALGPLGCKAFRQNIIWHFVRRLNEIGASTDETAIGIFVDQCISEATD